MAFWIASLMALGVTLVSACTAGGGCDTRVDEIVERSMKQDYPDALKNDLRQLRDAALVFAQRGRDAACTSIAIDMDDMLDDITQAMAAAREQAARRAYLEAATPVTQISGLIKAEDIVGAPVLNLQDEELGAIENVALDPDTGDIAYVALTTGGFLGLGEKWIAVPWKDLSRTRDAKNFVLDLTTEALAKMQGFDASRWPDQAAARLPEQPSQLQQSMKQGRQPETREKSSVDQGGR
jgi:sporulation protein YlmC with PRC-barrel domain